MLVLSRKPGEVIWVGKVKLVLVRLGDGTARLGITAPTDVPIVREELLSKADVDKLNDGLRK